MAKKIEEIARKAEEYADKHFAENPETAAFMSRKSIIDCYLVGYGVNKSTRAKILAKYNN